MTPCNVSVTVSFFQRRKRVDFNHSFLQKTIVLMLLEAHDCAVWTKCQWCYLKDSPVPLYNLVPKRKQVTCTLSANWNYRKLRSCQEGTSRREPPNRLPSLGSSYYIPNDIGIVLGSIETSACFGASHFFKVWFVWQLWLNSYIKRGEKQPKWWCCTFKDVLLLCAPPNPSYFLSTPLFIARLSLLSLPVFTTS